MHIVFFHGGSAKAIFRTILEGLFLWCVSSRDLFASLPAESFALWEAGESE